MTIQQTGENVLKIWTDIENKMTSDKGHLKLDLDDAYRTVINKTKEIQKEKENLKNLPNEDIALAFLQEQLQQASKFSEYRTAVMGIASILGDYGVLNKDNTTDPCKKAREAHFVVMSALSKNVLSKLFLSWQKKLSELFIEANILPPQYRHSIQEAISNVNNAMGKNDIQIGTLIYTLKETAEDARKRLDTADTNLTNAKKFLLKLATFADYMLKTLNREYASYRNVLGVQAEASSAFRNFSKLIQDSQKEITDKKLTDNTSEKFKEHIKKLKNILNNAKKIEHRLPSSILDKLRIDLATSMAITGENQADINPLIKKIKLKLPKEIQAEMKGITFFNALAKARDHIHNQYEAFPEYEKAMSLLERVLQERSHDRHAKTSLGIFEKSLLRKLFKFASGSTRLNGYLQHKSPLTAAEKILSSYTYVTANTSDPTKDIKLMNEALASSGMHVLHEAMKESEETPDSPENAKLLDFFNTFPAPITHEIKYQGLLCDKLQDLCQGSSAATIDCRELQNHIRRLKKETTKEKENDTEQLIATLESLESALASDQPIDEILKQLHLSLTNLLPNESTKKKPRTQLESRACAIQALINKYNSDLKKNSEINKKKNEIRRTFENLKFPSYCSHWETITSKKYFNFIDKLSQMTETLKGITGASQKDKKNADAFIATLNAYKKKINEFKNLKAACTDAKIPITSATTFDDKDLVSKPKEARPHETIRSVSQYADLDRVADILGSDESLLPEKIKENIKNSATVLTEVDEVMQAFDDYQAGDIVLDDEVWQKSFKGKDTTEFFSEQRSTIDNIFDIAKTSLTKGAFAIQPLFTGSRIHASIATCLPDINGTPITSIGDVSVGFCITDVSHVNSLYSVRYRPNFENMITPEAKAALQKAWPNEDVTQKLHTLYKQKVSSFLQRHNARFTDGNKTTGADKLENSEKKAARAFILGLKKTIQELVYKIVPEYKNEPPSHKLFTEEEIIANPELGPFSDAMFCSEFVAATTMAALKELEAELAPKLKGLKENSAKSKLYKEGVLVDDQSFITTHPDAQEIWAKRYFDPVNSSTAPIKYLHGTVDHWRKSSGLIGNDENASPLLRHMLS